ncbi:MAG: hypothetical protein IIY32_11820, partial [Thermoguttaceae bacterium]|nr:hypothetical protein [Thermoguttaceae bacterium]
LSLTASSADETLPTSRRRCAIRPSTAPARYRDMPASRAFCWMFYVLMGRYEYCNSLWDEVNAYVPDQAVSLYPGVGKRTISTRTAEAIRAAVDRWRAARLEEQAQKQTN